MARINVDEEFWTDPRIELLAAKMPRHEAYGTVLVLWRTGQMYWKKKSLIPIEIFAQLPHHELLRTSSFVSVRKDGVYVSGSNERWMYLNPVQQSQAGKKSAASRKRKFGTSQPNGARTEPERSFERKSNGTEPYSSSSSSSSSSSFPNTTYSGENDSPDVSFDKSTENPVSTWMRLYKAKYKSRYPLQGKDSGMLSNMLKSFKARDIEIMFTCYLAIEDSLYKAQRHSLGLFFRDLPKVAQAAHSGVNPADPLSFLEAEMRLEQENQITIQDNSND